MKQKSRSACPICFALDLFGDKWSLLILRDILFKDKKYYHEFVDAEEGIATNVLADRLATLEESGLIGKKTDPSNLKKFIYSPTAKSLDLLPMLTEMILWGAKHDSQGAVTKTGAIRIEKDKKAFIKSISGKFRKRTLPSRAKI